MKKDKNIYLRAAKIQIESKTGACSCIGRAAKHLLYAVAFAELFGKFFKPSERELVRYNMSRGYWLRAWDEPKESKGNINTRQIALLLMHEIYQDL